MYRQFLTIGMVCLMAVLVVMVPKRAEAQDKITGPWLWMIAPTEAGQGGAESTDIDSLAVASGGTVTEADVAANGANIGDRVGDYAWTLSTIRNSGITNTGCCQGTEIDNVTDVLLRIGWADGDVDDHSSYALITLESATVQNNVRMRVGSDDSIKVWLNGEVVHKNAINRGAWDFQDDFQVNLVAGDNLLLIKVSEGWSNWSMFAGIEADVNAVYKPPANGGLRFSPNVIADQTFTVGTPVNLTLPFATGGTAPYTYALTTPQFPNGLQFDPATRELHGTPLTPMDATPVTYTATDATGASASLTFTITVQDTPAPTEVYMYWASWSFGSIQRAKLDGTHLQDVVTGLVSPRDVALDIARNKMYWVDADGHKLQRANLDGTNLQDLVNTQGRPFGVAVDTMSGKVYWSIWGPGKIRRANLDGSNVEDFVTGLSEPEDIDLDLSAGKIYWTDTVTNKIQRANLDRNPNVEDLVTVGLSHSLGLTLDVAAGKMYWTNTSFWPGPWPGHDKIQRANLDGTNVEDLLTVSGVAGGIALDVSADKMYWAESGKIWRANLDGTNVEEAIVGNVDIPIGPTGIALGIPQTSGGLRFDPNMIADQTFTIGTSVSLTLPTATGGAPPYTYTLTPSLPAGLSFAPPPPPGGLDNFEPASIVGTPTAALPPTPFTYTATDASGASASLTFTITVELNLDVNGDGTVDVLDLIWVAVSYQMRGDALLADVNADGVVNVQDLVAVANAIDAAEALPAKVAEEVALAAEAAAAREGAAGAPVMPFSSRSVGMSGLTAHRNVAGALADVRALAGSDARLDKWLPLLEELLQMITEMQAIPETTALLPNYPNPFNPETWIPYHLAYDAAVIVTIYDVRGSMVRELVFGHQTAGVYESRGRAAYWDGRNQYGEKVASGLYFYTLSTQSTRNSVTAGDFTATRKLLIAK